jgi:hypothetical protein
MLVEFDVHFGHSPKNDVREHEEKSADEIERNFLEDDFSSSRTNSPAEIVHVALSFGFRHHSEIKNFVLIGVVGSLMNEVETTPAAERKEVERQAEEVDDEITPGEQKSFENDAKLEFRISSVVLVIEVTRDDVAIDGGSVT